MVDLFQGEGMRERAADLRVELAMNESIIKAVEYLGKQSRDQIGDIL